MLLMIALPRGDSISSQWAFAGLAVLAAFFFLGAFTPVLCTLSVCIEITAIFGLRGVDALHMVFSILETAALGLLGPGGYSLDALMFGRRRVILSTDESSDVN
jgi:Na+-translocating ferredoxin:NAD+ oxidoreductase RnfE subunit